MFLQHMTIVFTFGNKDFGISVPTTFQSKSAGQPMFLFSILHFKSVSNNQDILELVFFLLITMVRNKQTYGYTYERES